MKNICYDMNLTENIKSQYRKNNLFKRNKRSIKNINIFNNILI